MTNADKIKQAITVLSGICPRVDQYYTIATPVKEVVNLLVTVNEDLEKQSEPPDAGKADEQ